MSIKSYLSGRWVVCENRGSQISLGHFQDGVGFAMGPSERVFSIKDGSLFGPDGAELGELIGLGESWAVSLGNYNTGQILREV